MSYLYKYEKKNLVWFNTQKQVLYCLPSLDFQSLYPQLKSQDLIYLQAPIVWRSVNAIPWINLYPVDNAIPFTITYPLNSDLSNG